jgi:hypothetical protein
MDSFPQTLFDQGEAPSPPLKTLSDESQQMALNGGPKVPRAMHFYHQIKTRQIKEGNIGGQTFFDIADSSSDHAEDQEPAG